MKNGDFDTNSIELWRKNCKFGHYRSGLIIQGDHHYGIPGEIPCEFLDQAFTGE